MNKSADRRTNSSSTTTVKPLQLVREAPKLYGRERIGLADMCSQFKRFVE